MRASTLLGILPMVIRDQRWVCNCIVNSSAPAPTQQILERWYVEVKRETKVDKWRAAIWPDTTVLQTITYTFVLSTSQSSAVGTHTHKTFRYVTNLSFSLPVAPSVKNIILFPPFFSRCHVRIRPESLTERIRFVYIVSVGCVVLHGRVSYKGNRYNDK